jgi:hypothetical protein
MREMNVKGASGLIVCIQSVSFLLENSGHESGNVTTQIAQLDRGLYIISQLLDSTKMIRIRGLPP